MQLSDLIDPNLLAKLSPQLDTPDTSSVGGGPAVDAFNINNTPVPGTQSPVSSAPQPHVSLFQRILSGLGSGLNTAHDSFANAYMHVPDAYRGLMSDADVRAAQNEGLRRMGSEMMGANAPPGTFGVPIGISMAKGAQAASDSFKQNIQQMLQDQTTGHALQHQLGEAQEMQAIKAKYPARIDPTTGTESPQSMLARIENMGTDAVMAGYPELGGKLAGFAKALREGRAAPDRNGWMSIGGDAFNTQTGQFRQGPSSTGRLNIASGTLSEKWTALQQMGEQKAAVAWQAAYAKALSPRWRMDPKTGLAVATIYDKVPTQAEAAQIADKTVQQLYPQAWLKIQNRPASGTMPIDPTTGQQVSPEDWATYQQYKAEHPDEQP